jgi:D-arabinose 1-dehydrogenase-like Zn-dependent alcohol dehydrogenase
LARHTISTSSGHEVAGVIDELGANVKTWSKGQRVGVGWYGGHCGVCIACRRGILISCHNASVTGFTFDGGYSEYLVAPAQALAAIPDDVAFDDAAPLMCAGVTTFNALRHSGALPGDLVGIEAIGGLGHLAVQFANKFGYRTVAISRGAEAKELALKLGAHAYIDTEAVKPSEELQRLGGAKTILATAPSGKAMSALIDGLGSGRGFHGTDRGCAGSIAHGAEDHPGMGRWRSGRFRRHPAIFGDDRSTADDREIPAGPSAEDL